MKRTNYNLMLTMLLFFGMVSMANAQFDDIYFDPADADEIYAQVDLEKYSAESYESKSVKPDDYEYYYASRIRRFDRPYYGFDFYSPVYVDPYYYNPAYANFYRPGSSIYGTGTGITVTSGYGYGSYLNPSWGYGGSAFGGYGTAYNRYGFGRSYNGYGASYGGGYGGFGGFGGSSYNPYCPPSVYSIYNNPWTGVFQPGTTSAPNPNSRSGSAVTGSTVYGPRGSGVGSVNTSPRNTTRPGTTGSAPDRPLVASNGTTNSSRAAQKTYAGENGSSRSSYAGPRSSRPVYTAPSRTTSSGVSKTSNVRNRFSSTRPSRPSANAYSPSARSYSTSGTRSSYSPSRSSSSLSSSGTSSRSFSSSRSSGGASKSSGASRSGGSPRK